jgi:hypothetical protein
VNDSGEIGNFLNRTLHGLLNFLGIKWTASAKRPWSFSFPFASFRRRLGDHVAQLIEKLERRAGGPPALPLS